MTFIKTLLVMCICTFLPLSPAQAEGDVDWTMEQSPIYEAGPGTPVVGTRWTIGSIREAVQFTLHLDTQTDMMQGNWHGDIRARERFFSKLYLVDAAGRRSYLKIDSAQAIGPDAEYGAWKTGPATAEVQIMRFDFTRDKLMQLNTTTSLVLNYASFETPDDTTDIIFPMEHYQQALAALDTSVRSVGGEAYLMTEQEIQSVPMNTLPQSIQNKLRDGLAEVSDALLVPVSELMRLSMAQVNDKIDSKKEAQRDAAKAAKRAEYQAIYDLEPDWLDLNLCPKADVSFCANVGRQAYANDMLVGGEFDYGEVMGVVWRSEGSIVRVYGGIVEYDIEPDVYRADEAEYYYIVKNDEGYLDVRACDGMLMR